MSEAETKNEIRVVREVRVTLTDEQHRAKGQALASAYRQRGKVKHEASEAAKAFKERIKNIEERIAELVRDVEEGTEDRAVDCYYDPQWSQGVVYTRRCDNGEAIEERTLTVEERQKQLFSEQIEEASRKGAMLAKAAGEEAAKAKSYTVDEATEEAATEEAAKDDGEAEPAPSSSGTEPPEERPPGIWEVVVEYGSEPFTGLRGSGLPIPGEVYAPLKRAKSGRVVRVTGINVNDPENPDAVMLQHGKAKIAPADENEISANGFVYLEDGIEWSNRNTTEELAKFVERYALLSVAEGFTDSE